MKRRDSFWDKLRVFIMWVKQEEGYGLRAACDFCGSTKIHKDKSQTKRIDEENIQYNALYACKDCGAMASVEEVWMKNK